MKGIFCHTKAKTNEEFRKELKRKNIMLGILAVLGLLTLGTAFWAHRYQVFVAEHTLGFYTGAGTGILVGTLFLLFRNIYIAKDETRLKNERLKNSDERIQEITMRAFRTASAAMLIAAYLICLIGGLFEPVLYKVLGMLAAVLMIGYIISYHYLNTRM